MCKGDIVFYPVNGGYIKYIITKVVGHDIFVKSFKTHSLNWIDASDVIQFEDFIKDYKDEEIFE